ncbi:MAG: DNA helicase RecQ [Paludibacteraceae bacterium]|nr:DNA helicase RecQ [Paludibacteraceae bacterium]
MVTHEDLLEVAKKHFGFDSFKGNQEQIITSLLEGKNVFVLMPTGGGKSLCYQLPALMMDGLAIVISPLIALMKNQVDMLRGYSENDTVAHFLNSALSRAEITKVKQDINDGVTKILYLAPEALKKKENIAFLQNMKISFYAIDEAHCISEWGHDFRPEYREIAEMVKMIGEAPMIALTSTATPKVQHDIQKNLDIEDAIVYKSSFNRPNLYYEVREKGDNVNKELIKFIRHMEGKSGIVYCLSRQNVNDLTNTLVSNGISAAPYHAGLDAETRFKNQDDFLMERVQVIVATIAFGMGIDKPDVRFVVHHDVPKSLEGYYQETGRAGRDGGEGICICFYSPNDIERLRKFHQDKTGKEMEVANQLLNEVQSYCESTICRRKFLLHYFGEEYGDHKCGKCDNCAKVYCQVDMTEVIILVLETVKTLNEQFDAKHIVDVLKGNKTVAVMNYKHTNLENFGELEDVEESSIQAVIRQALVDGLLSKDVQSYGILKLTKAGQKYLRKPYRFEIAISVKDNEDGDDIIMAGEGVNSVIDETLYSILKSVRRTISKKINMPPYVIFQDTSLEAMATDYPISIEELQNIPGVGFGKAKRYGEEFISVIKKYVAENDIVRPEDIRVKSTVYNSEKRIAIIQAIDRHCSIDMIADSLGMSMDEILTEIEAIVSAGRKLDINYYIDEVVEPDECDEICDYFRSAETPDLKTAMEKLGYDDFDETNIRLVRIKILSEWGN